MFKKIERCNNKDKVSIMENMINQVDDFKIQPYRFIHERELNYIINSGMERNDCKVFSDEFLSIHALLTKKEVKRLRKCSGLINYLYKNNLFVRCYSKYIKKYGYESIISPNSNVKKQKLGDYFVFEIDPPNYIIETTSNKGIDASILSKGIEKEK